MLTGGLVDYVYPARHIVGQGEEGKICQNLADVIYDVIYDVMHM